MAQYALHTAIGIVYVSSLREFFATHELAADYAWSTDSDKSRIEILEAWPETPQKFPLIVVDTMYSGEGERYLSDSAGPIMVNNSTEGGRLSGVDNFDVRITVTDHSKMDVDDVADILIFGLKRHIERAVMQATFMTVIPQRSVHMGGAGARALTDQSLLYSVTLSVPVKTHWFDEIIYDQRITHYLATAEREGLEAAATQFQMQAGNSS